MYLEGLDTKNKLLKGYQVLILFISNVSILHTMCNTTDHNIFYLGISNVITLKQTKIYYTLRNNYPTLKVLEEYDEVNN